MCTAIHLARTPFCRCYRPGATENWTLFVLVQNSRKLGSMAGISTQILLDVRAGPLSQTSSLEEMSVNSKSRTRLVHSDEWQRSRSSQVASKDLKIALSLGHET